MRQRQVTFLTGTRADFGKLSPLIRRLADSTGFEIEIVATGMHLLSKYGYTVTEILQKTGSSRVYPIFNQGSSSTEKMDIVLANTIVPLSHYLNERRPDLLVVHGDRVEALAGAIAGALNNVLVAHLEGGEVSGTIDESMRHATSKMAHVHLVANKVSRRRLLQLGEEEQSIFVIGSPEVDVMHSVDLPTIDQARARYAIEFPDYAIFIYHPVTTELATLEKNISEVIKALERTGHNYVAVRPNNDIGSEIISSYVTRFAASNQIRLLPSIRFEYYLTLLKHARYIVGNSSSGIREAPVFGVPCVNIGTRQRNRSENHAIFNVADSAEEIYDTIMRLPKRVAPCALFGDGNAAGKFVEILKGKVIWSVPRQKAFVDRAVL